MKNGKKPTVAQRESINVIAELDSRDWLVTKDTPVFMEIVHRVSGKLRKYNK